MNAKRALLVGLGAVLVLALAAAGGAYVYFFSGARSSPKPLSLSSPMAQASSSSTPAAAATGATGDLSGHWTVGQGSVAGYRVKEQFVGESSTHEAVARTTSVSGGLTAQQAAAGLQVTNMSFSAQLAGLRSEDQVVGHDVSFRDSIVRQSLDVSSYPQATFQADSVSVPSAMSTGDTVQLTVPGKITIRGVTRDAQATMQARLANGQVQIAGTIAMAMTDFGIQPPQVPFTSVQPQVTVEFQLVLTKS